MKKKQTQDEYYSLDEIKKRHADYNIIFGERSNGKTFAVLREAIEAYLKNGEQMALIRRYTEDFRGKRGTELYNPLITAGVIEKLSNGMWTHVHYYSGRWYLCRYEETDNGKTIRICDETPFSYGFSLASMEHDKGTRYPHIKIVLFDEFISRMGYIPDEFMLFLNCLSTIIGQRNDVVVYMLGNTVNKYCPYFAEMGLKHIREMKQGTIDLYKIESAGLSIAVEYCESKKRSKKSNKYFAFENQKAKMITHGIWEIDIYPHLPHKYRPRDVLFEFFNEFDGEMLHWEIVNVNGNVFAFVHRKTTPLRHPDTDIIYSTTPGYRANHRTNILRDTSKLSLKVRELISNEKVFYQDNEIGEIVYNYLQWCKVN